MQSSERGANMASMSQALYPAMMASAVCCWVEAIMRSLMWCVVSSLIYRLKGQYGCLALVRLRLYTVLFEGCFGTCCTPRDSDLARTIVQPRQLESVILTEVRCGDASARELPSKRLSDLHIPERGLMQRGVVVSLSRYPIICIYSL